MIKVSTPGKLYIAGEYAVVTPGHPAIIVAVDRFINIYIDKAEELGSIKTYGKTVFYSRENNRILLSKDTNKLSYILAAMNITEEYLRQRGIKLDYYNIEVESQLESPRGQKYGLGSSGAITVATVKALLKYYDLNLSNMEIFKLAALANIKINPKGSCGDIGASTFGAWIVFETFDKEWLLKKQGEVELVDLINMNWPGLHIEYLSPPKELKLVIGWTGSPASTIKLVNHMETNLVDRETIYGEFLSNSRKCVLNMVGGFRENNIEEIQKQIHINRELLFNMGRDLGLSIETPKLKKLCDIAIKYGGAPKSSGAGGGDCGIGIFKDNDNIDGLIEEWEKEGIISNIIGVNTDGNHK